MGSLGLEGVLRFHGAIADLTAKGVLFPTSMYEYESFGLNIGEAMAVGAFPVVHDFPGAGFCGPRSAGTPASTTLSRFARTGLYRDWVGERYGLDRQQRAVLRLLADLT